MTNSLKQSMKQRMRVVAKTSDLTFGEIWHNFISAVNGWLTHHTQLFTFSIDSFESFDKEV